MAPTTSSALNYTLLFSAVLTGALALGCNKKEETTTLGPNDLVVVQLDGTKKVMRKAELILTGKREDRGFVDISTLGNARALKVEGKENSYILDLGDTHRRLFRSPRGDVQLVHYIGEGSPPPPVSPPPVSPPPSSSVMLSKK